ncbi:unnamed protein product, partial [marine sediment metagenome]
SYSQLILYPWGYTDQPTDEDLLLEQIAVDMSELIQAVNGNVYEYGQAGELLYVTNGDTTDWTFGIYGIPSYTIELPPDYELHGGFFNAEKDIQSIFNENLPAMLYLIDWSIQNSTSRQDTFRRIKQRPKERLKVKNKIRFKQDSLGGQGAQDRQYKKIKAQNLKPKTEVRSTSGVKSKRKNASKNPYYRGTKKKK